MAKKGGVQQLQADISSDEEFEKFLQRPGLLILDIYSEWCGPCLGMVGSLRKIKLELGGDNLQLAICKAGSISSLARFNKKSEPTWMFVTNGKAINIMFGTDVPKLVAMITKTLASTMAKETQHYHFYEITELQPIELEQQRIKNLELRRAEVIEEDEAKKKRIEYLRFVTDTIMENLPDIGITVFGPQVNRDMFKKLAEPADPLKIQCKDRKVFAITENDMNTVNFAAENPLSREIIEQLYDKELLMCFWKVEEILGTPPSVLRQYAHELTKETIKPPDEFNEEEIIVPPLIVPLEMNVEIIEETPVAEEQANENVAKETTTMETTDKGEDPEEADEDDQGKEEKDEVPLEAPEQKVKTKTIKIPPIWVPNDQRTHAALIYTYFRAQTSAFLPPDPVPEPPHIIMTFDSYKKKDLAHILDVYRDDIPLYGFFTSDKWETAVFIANSVDKYNAKPYVPTDKIIVKVNKVKGNPAMPLLMAFGPSYVSPNSVIGHQEAGKFFPPTYKSVLQEEAELLAVKTEKPKKRKKNKKGAEADAGNEDKIDSASNQDQQEAKTSPEEGASTTSSGEDSCESRPPTADGQNVEAVA
ncbi:uncharacterized protein Dwil_GK25405 [Drosophila willistoni]|uniref:DUF4746 domain-containing protein n=1 Tax=Drosophila willistoni TaxID=7260 RepID=B4NDU9_DROWI|nr:uncharacterized protein LOC6649172 [Drosophila willistoni]EDW81918.1 uncharacterized protein Dwil_GK25405 [Drosophila willistoni]